MFIFAHFLFGLIIGKISGNYLVALIGALFIDLDHLVVYIKKGIIFKPKKLWKIIIDANDPYGFQRNFLHNFFVWIVLSIIILIFDFKIGIIFSLAYLSHLFLDSLDGSDFYPFYPWKFNVRGPIRYLSLSELIFTLILLLVYVLI